MVEPVKTKSPSEGQRFLAPQIGGRFGTPQFSAALLLSCVQRCGSWVRLGVSGDLRQHHALLTAPSADHVQRRLAAGAIKRASQNLAIDGDNTLNLLAKARHEPLKRGAEPRRIELAE